MSKYDVDMILKLSDGIMKSREIADIVGCPVKYVQKIWSKNPHIKRPAQAPPSGSCNPAWAGGRSLCKDGYVCISRYKNRQYEHRMVMESHLGRSLLKREVVDHIDGCTLHNDIKNLRLFPSNADHLRATLTGNIPNWSGKGLKKMNSSRIDRANNKKVCIYHYRRKCGGIRILQILLAHELLDKDSPYLLGMERYLEKEKVDVDHFLKSKMTALKYLQQALPHLWCEEYLFH